MINKLQSCHNYLFILLCFFSTSIYANSNNICDEFYENIRVLNNKYELYANPIFEQEEPLFGVTFDQTYDSEKNQWIYKRNDNNNIIIFNTNYYSNSYNKILSKDIILSLNDILVQDLTDEEFDKILSMNDKINFKIKRYVNYNEVELNFDIEKSIFDQVTEVTPIFRINSFKNIDIKNTEYTINYDFEYWWLDNRLIDLLKPSYEKEIGKVSDLIQKKKDELGNEFNEDTFVAGWWCELTLDEFYEKDLFLWHPEIEFINIVKNDLENREVSITFNYNIYGENYEELYLNTRDKGIATFTTKFDLRAFPFDSHELEFVYADTKHSISSQAIDYDGYITLPLDEKLKSKVLEWNIKGNYANYEAIKYYDKYDYIYDGIKTFFIIERNSSYYVYKVIAPIILILIVCWSVFWLRTDQIESRLTVSIVCLLTLIAYNFVIDENIPKLPYLTAMDQIILSSYFFASIPTILSIYYVNLADKNKLHLLNSQKYIRILGPIIYFLAILIIMYSNINKNPSALGTMKIFFG